VILGFVSITPAIFVWSFFAMVYDGQQLTAYLNGETVFKGVFDKPMVKNSSPLFIGMNEPEMKEYFDGAFDDLYVFNTALAAAAIKRLYEEQRTPHWEV
jgi:hypothetical protein